MEAIGLARWTDRAFVARAQRWLRRAAERRGYAVTGPIEQPHLRPWSTVFRAPTSRGPIFLKCCGPSQAYEPKLTELLARTARSAVPTLIARHRREDWMLLADGGTKLREAFNGVDLLRAWERILPRYAELQVALLAWTRDLVATGAPDYPLERLPALVTTLLDDRGLTRRPGYDRLSSADRRRIEAALPTVATQCERLAALGIGRSVQHDDLHGNNVLRRGSRTVIFDWGDACITHPFLSLTIALRAAARSVRTTERDRRVLRLRDAYLEPFGRFAAPSRLREGARIGAGLGIITRAMSWYRVITLSGGAPDIGTETFAGWLRLLPRAFRRPT